jgi:hypothetical protein
LCTCWQPTAKTEIHQTRARSSDVSLSTKKKERKKEKKKEKRKEKKQWCMGTNINVLA